MKTRLTQAELGQRLGLDGSTINKAVQRLRRARLLAPGQRGDPVVFRTDLVSFYLEAVNRATQMRPSASVDAVATELQMAVAKAVDLEHAPPLDKATLTRFVELLHVEALTHRHRKGQHPEASLVAVALTPEGLAQLSRCANCRRGLGAGVLRWTLAEDGLESDATSGYPVHEQCKPARPLEGQARQMSLSCCWLCEGHLWALPVPVVDLMQELEMSRLTANRARDVESWDPLHQLLRRAQRLVHEGQTSLLKATPATENLSRCLETVLRMDLMDASPDARLEDAVRTLVGAAYSPDPMLGVKAPDGRRLGEAIREWRRRAHARPGLRGQGWFPVVIIEGAPYHPSCAARLAHATNSGAPQPPGWVVSSG